MNYRNKWKYLIITIFTLNSVITIMAQDMPRPHRFTGGMNLTETTKVENNGNVSNLFDELNFYMGLTIGKYTHFYALLDIGEIMYESGWRDAGNGPVFQDDGFKQTEIYLESDVLKETGISSPVELNLKLSYGSHQGLLTMDFTQYRFERSGTSGIDGFNFRTAVGFNNRFYLTAAFNPVSFESIKSGGYPDVFTSFYMKNDHHGSSWGPLIHFTSSSMQLFYDSSANLENNRLYDDLSPRDAMTLGIGGTLVMDFAGIEILGFGMTEYFLMYNRNNFDILQAEWGAGFKIPVLSGIDANLSGNNGIRFSGTGDNNYINFGLDVKTMFTDIFGVFGAVAGIGILDEPGLSAEAGLSLNFKYIQINSGYSNHALWTKSKYAKGAFDKVETTSEGRAPGGGFFITLKSSFQ